jgi:hypothetical protein
MPMSRGGSRRGLERFVSTARISSPTSVRHIAPWPPKVDVPPLTTTAIASSAMVPPMSACPTLNRDAMIMLASAAQAPRMRYVLARSRPTRRPASRAASLLPPTT